MSIIHSSKLLGHSRFAGNAPALAMRAAWLANACADICGVCGARITPERPGEYGRAASGARPPVCPLVCPPDRWKRSLAADGVGALSATGTLKRRGPGVPTAGAASILGAALGNVGVLGRSGGIVRPAGAAGGI